MLPGVVSTVAVGVREVDSRAVYAIELDIVASAMDHNPRPITIGDVVAQEPILISANAYAAVPPQGRGACICVYSNDVIDQVVLVPQNGDAAVKAERTTVGLTVNQAIVVSHDVEGGARTAPRLDIDKPVVITRYKSVAIYRGVARHIPHNMSASAFEDNDVVQRLSHRAVPELCALPGENHTPYRRSRAGHGMPIQIEDRPIAERERSSDVGARQVLLQSKVPSWAKHIAAALSMGGGHTAQSESQHSEDHGDNADSSTGFPQLVLHRFPSFLHAAPGGGHRGRGSQRARREQTDAHDLPCGAHPRRCGLPLGAPPALWCAPGVAIRPSRLGVCGSIVCSRGVRVKRVA